MDPSTIGILGIIILFMLIFLLNMEIGFAFGLAGFFGIWALRGLEPAYTIVATVPYRLAMNYIFSVLPLFMLVGYLAGSTRLSTDAFFAANKWMGHMRGGLAMGTVGACTIFAAISGCSIATATTVATIALPEMRKFKYDDELSLGCIAAGGTLGFMIPPSIGFIIYAILTELSIGHLFMAGILPGLLLSILLMITIYLICKIKPQAAPPTARASWGERLMALKGVSGILAIVVLVLGGIYTGIFTPTEAAAAGVFGVLVLGLALRRLTWSGLNYSLRETAKLAGMIFILIIGGILFNTFMVTAEIPLKLAAVIEWLNVPAFAILVAVMLAYIVLGFFMDIMAVIVFAVPILHPVLVALGFDPIWLAVITMITVLMGHISPPIGIVVYALSAVVGVPVLKVFKGALPFLAAIFIGLVIIMIFPQIALLLPSLMIPG